ncbi:helix-turn-helix domain-containing protein [Taklimakanibacter deserti]|uniref:helix-turn-helix domain-containing protein n=1 Tax=Taklimakanibacter deserti TaxID=2267839 RepID=UPI0034D4689C
MTAKRQKYKPARAKEMVVPKAEYDELIAAAKAKADEDAADVAIFDERLAELVAGKTQILPVEVSAGIMRGDKRIKAIRKWRSIPQIKLAKKLAISQAHLSDVEAGKRSLTPAIAAKAAKMLDVPVDWLT